MKIYRAVFLLLTGVAGVAFLAATVACSDDSVPSQSTPPDGSDGKTSDAATALPDAAEEPSSDAGPQDASLSDAEPGTTCVGGPFPAQTASATCSLNSEQPLELTFVNNSARAVSIYWVNYSCVEVLETALQPCETFSINSYVAHPWRIRDVTTGTLYKEFIPTSTAVSTVTVH